MLEKKVNSVLFNICSIITVIALVMMLIEFFSRGAFPPARVGLFYIIILIMYSLHKELLRHFGKKGDIQKKGEYFVYLWVAITLVLYMINFLSKDYFFYSDSGQRLPALSEITYTTLEVCAVFISTRLFKMWINKLQKMKKAVKVVK